MPRKNLLLADEFDILNEIGRWKITHLKNLYTGLSASMAYGPFTQKVKKLETHGLVKSFNIVDRKRKYLGLTDQGAKISRFKSVYDSKHDCLNHELISSQVLKELLKMEDIVAGHIYHDEGLSVAPDAVVYLRRGGENLIMAVEVELTQKSKRRYVDKFVRYSNGQDFHFALYVFNSFQVWHRYYEAVSGMHEDVQDKIILCLDQNLNFRSFDYRRARYWYQGKEQSFSQLFE